MPRSIPPPSQNRVSWALTKPHLGLPLGGCGTEGGTVKACDGTGMGWPSEFEEGLQEFVPATAAVPIST